MSTCRIICLSLALVLAGGAGRLATAQQPLTATDRAFDEQFEQGRQSLRQGNFRNAIDALNRASKLRENCSVCYYFLAIAYLHSGQMTAGVKSIDKAIATAGDDRSRAAGHNLKGDAMLSLAVTDKKMLASAQAEYGTAVQLDPKMAAYHMNFAKVLLRQSQDAQAKAELETCLRLNPDAHTARQIQLLIADPRRGQYEFAPEFDALTLQGQKISLEQFSGKIVVMDFWATWCRPCRDSVPELRELTRKYPTSKLVLISVSSDENDQAWRDFVSRKSMDWPQYRDANGRVVDSFGVHAFPTYLVIDGDGMIRERITGLNPQQSVVHRLKATLQQMPQLEGEGGK
jgi:thioredoxin-like negative regulator of GroEL